MAIELLGGNGIKISYQDSGQLEAIYNINATMVYTHRGRDKDAIHSKLKGAEPLHSECNGTEAYGLPSHPSLKN